MKKNVWVLSAVIFMGCTNQHQQVDKLANDLAFAEQQATVMLDSLTNKNPYKTMPASLDQEGNLKLTTIYGWSSGFFSGSLWYLYEHSADEFWKEKAKEYTGLLDSVQYFSGHHDVGFIMQCSYGNGYRLTQDSTYKPVLIQAARSLAKRYNPQVGAILSWNVNNNSWQSKRGWKFPVIADNMMNLELLFNATKLSGDSTFFKIAVSHADKTLDNHFRPDYSAYHVIDYDPETGEVLHRHNAQGHSDESTWSRGLSWLLYGYTMCYRHTGYKRYLQQAEQIARFMMKHPRLPKNHIPYWDYDSPEIPNTYQDVSAGTIAASGLLELSSVTTKERKSAYLGFADTMLNALRTSSYRYNLGEGKGFLLKHSVGSVPHNSGIDVPLIYADYYYLEALLRRKNLN